MPSSADIRFAVVIPAYKPSAGLIDLVRTLASKAMPAIVIVDDGGGPEFADIFARVAEFPGVHLLRHAVNLGKGAALKTAFNYVLCTFPHIAGVVTADADGQHHPDDIEAVAGRLVAQPDALVLGSRSFGSDVPLRSRFGNVLTRSVMHALLGRKITDTQTGLRGIPAGMLAKLMRLEATGYEFELEMLLAAHHLDIPIAEQPIRTIYEQGNPTSHFNPIVDSMKIYFVLLRFGSISFLSALLDNLIFYIVWKRTGLLLASQVVARVFAVTFNYTMVRSSVFYSRQQHKAVLPKYLGLVMVSGTASYLGIRHLHDQFGVNTMAAKILVETFLFFVNFAVQRLFIFKPGGGHAPAELARRERVWTGTVPVLLFGGLFAILAATEIYGFSTAHLFDQEIWQPVGIHRFTRFLGIFIALGVPLLVILPWIFAALMALLLLVLTAVSVGPLPVLAVALFLLSASALGSLLLGRGAEDSLATHVLATLAGIAVYIALMTPLARVPVHYPAVWAGVLALPVLVDARGVWRRLRFWAASLRGAELRSGWTRAALAVLLFLVVAQWFVALKPEVGADGLAMHLAIPIDIAAHHALTFEPARILWAVMPMGADWCYSIVYLLGGEYAARLLNFAMLLAVLGLIYSAARRWLTPAPALLIAASFAATPVVQMVTGSLFVENLLAALVLAVLTATWKLGETGSRRYLYAAMLLAGAAVSTKLGSMAFLAVALPFLVYEVLRRPKALGRRPWLHAALAAGLLLACALPPYAIAWVKTGNPIFPFQNQKFRSPLLDPGVDLNDPRFHIPLGAGTLYTLTFRTADAWEGQHGSFGFQYLVVAPLALAGLLVLRRSRRVAVSAVAVALLASAIVMASQPNVRYLYAAMPPILVGFAALLGWAAQRAWLYRTLAVYLVAATALNAWFLPSSSYYHKDFCLRLPFSRAERERYKGEAAPIRKVIDYYNGAHPRSTVLLTASNESAGLTGNFYANHWHQYPVLERIQHAPSAEALFELLRGWHIDYLISPKPTAGEPLSPPTLKKLIDFCTVPEFEAGDTYLAQLEPDCEQRIASYRPPREPSLMVAAGYYDDLDPAILFRGDWYHDQTFAEPFRHTIAYTDRAGADASIAFEGESLTYIYSKAPNRGIAEVVIDGQKKGRLDLYSPRVLWQATERYCCFGAGRHKAEFRVTGDRNPQSSGSYVDVDGFVVK